MGGFDLQFIWFELILYGFYKLIVIFRTSKKAHELNLFQNQTSCALKKIWLDFILVIIYLISINFIWFYILILVSLCLEILSKIRWNWLTIYLIWINFRRFYKTVIFRTGKKTWVDFFFFKTKRSCALKKIWLNFCFSNFWLVYLYLI